MALVKFPDEVFLGDLYIAKREDKKTWVLLGEAKGEVLVPDDSVLYLEMKDRDRYPELINFELPLWHFASLEPDDLYALFCRGIIGENFRYISRLNLKSLDIGIVRDPDSVLQNLQDLPTLRFLSLNGSRSVSKGAIANLENLPALEALDLGETGIEDEDVARISQLENLFFLNISGTPTTDLALEYLKDHQTLETLLLDGNRVTDEGLAHLNGLILRELYIGYTKVTENILHSLAKLKNLRKLLLPGIPKIDLSGIKNLPALEYLDLHSVDLSEQDLSYLIELPVLEYLNLEQAKLNEQDLSYLTELPALKTLNIKYTKISSVGLKELRKKLPQVEILSELKG